MAHITREEVVDILQRSDDLEQPASVPDDLSDLDLSGLDFSRGFLLHNIRFDRAKLCGARFCGKWIKDASFVGADLEGADFENAILQQVNFTGAKLDRANLRGARIEGAIISQAQLSLATTGISSSQVWDIAAVVFRILRILGALFK